MTIPDVSAAGPLAGQKVAITGPMTGPLAGLRRPEAIRLLQEAGASTAGSVSARTTLLVASRPRTRKSRRADELGLKVIGPGELAELLGYPTLF